jgi:uncharacterized protein
MKKVLVLIVVSLASITLKAQTHKIIFQLMSEDTLAHRSLMKQLNNVLSISPDAKIEVVCQGPGLSMLMLSKTTVQESISKMKAKGVVFAACEFSMSERKVTKEQIVPESGFVKSGIMEVITKQEEGWGYIKSGF